MLLRLAFNSILNLIVSRFIRGGLLQTPQQKERDVLSLRNDGSLVTQSELKFQIYSKKRHVLKKHQALY